MDNGYVLSPISGKSVTKVCDASFSTIVANAKGLHQLFLVPDIHDQKWGQILKSYPRVTLRKPPNRFSLFRQLVGAVRATIAYLRIRTIEDLLAFRQDGIRFGDVLYDEILSGGYATVSGIDRRTWSVLRRFYVLRGFVLHILNRYSIKSSVFAQRIGLHGSTLSRYLLSRGVELFLRVGTHQFIVYRYRNLQDSTKYPIRPDQQLFTRMLERDDGTIRKKVDAYLDQRFSQGIDHPTLHTAFDVRKKTYTRQDDFCADYSLDPAKPLVFVMLHAFNDSPHSHFAKPMLFQDYYWWFRNTLSLAQRNTRVNWIFKDHPAAPKYLTRDVNLGEMFTHIQNDNIRFLPWDADFNARSISNIAHALVTCIGTAGLEYSTQGIPCVLAGESAYDGYGFTHEPQTQEEYAQVLLSIKTLPRLTPEQILRAKMVAYYYFCIAESSRYYFCPVFTDQEIIEWTPESEARLWKETAEAVRDPLMAEKMKEQVQELTRYILDDTRTQYFDLRQFPFLQDAEG
jgi:hypothetical protein